MSAYIQQHRFTFRIMTAIYFLPAGYHQHQYSFVEKRCNLASFGIGLLMSFGYFYHDFFLQNAFFVSLAPFAMAVVLLEMLLFATVPLCIVLNNFFHRKRLTKLLNVLFADDNLLDMTCVRMGSGYCVYVSFLIAVVMLFEIWKMFAKETEAHKMLTTTFVIRFVTVLQFLYFFHLCVSMVGLRMQQLKVLFEQKQHEDDFEYFLNVFITRYERYVVQIEQINRCFAFPVMAILALGMIELSFFVFESIYTMNTGLPDREMYNGFEDWVFSQLWQSLYINFLLLAVSSCESTRKKVRNVMGKILKIFSCNVFLTVAH